MPGASPSSAMRSCTSGAASRGCAARRGVSGSLTMPAAARYGTMRAAKSSSVEQADVVAVDRLGLLQVEARRVGVDVDDVERGDHLVDREHVAVVGERPAEQREVVEQALGDEAAVAVVEQVRLGVALGQLLVALAHHVGQVAEARDERRSRRCR